MFNLFILRKNIIRPALIDIGMHTDINEQIIYLSFVNKSLERWDEELVDTNSLGLYGMSPETHNLIWHLGIIKDQKVLLKMINNFDCNRTQDEYRLVYDMRYATVMKQLEYTYQNLISG